MKTGIHSSPVSGLEKITARLVLMLAFLLTAIASPGRDIAVWTGKVDRDWTNPDNWDITLSGTYSETYWYNTHPMIPYENTMVTLPVTVNAITMDLVNKTGLYRAIEFNMLSEWNGATLNLRGSDDDTDPWLKFELDGVGVRAPDVSERPQLVFNVGKNATLIFSGAKAGGLDRDDTVRPTTTNAWNSVLTGNTAFVFLRLRDNAIFDITGIDYGTDKPSTAVANGPYGARVSTLDATPGTKVILGKKALYIGSNQTKFDGNEFVCAADIDASIDDGGGILIKDGYGTCILTGSNNFQVSGTLANYIDSNGFLAVNAPLLPELVIYNISRLEGGGLIIGENSSIGAIRVFNSNRADMVLGGSGTTGTVFFQSGIVSPGMGQNNRETGTLKINGHYLQLGTQAANGTTTLWIDIGRGGNYDKLAISGSASIGADSKLRLWSPSGYMMPGEYKFLTAAMGVTGKFSGSNAAIANSLTLTVEDPDDPVKVVNESGGAQSLVVRLKQEKFAEVEGFTKGQKTVAGYLDYLVSLGDPSNVDTVDPLVGFMNGKAMRKVNDTALELDADGRPATTLRLLMDAINQISPQHYVHIYEAAIASLNTITEGVARHTGRPYAGKNAEKFSLYANFDYDTVTTPMSDDVEAAKLKTFYYTIGGSKHMGKNVIVGGEFSYGDGVFKSAGTASKTDATQMTFSLYGALKAGRLDAGALALLGVDKYKTHRDVSATHVADFIKSDADGHRHGASGWISYAIPAGQSYTIKPYASLHWLDWKMDGFKETGVESLALEVAGQSATIFESRAGVRVESTFYARNLNNRAYRVFLDLGWVSLLEGAGARVIDTNLNGYPMNVEVPALKRTGWRGSVGVLADITNALKFQLEATGQMDGGLDKQFSYQGSFIYKF